TTQIIAQGLPAGFQAFSPDHTKMLFSDGIGQQNPAMFFRYSGDGAPAGMVSLGAAFQDKRATQPDWTKDGLTVYFTVPGSIFTWDNNGPTTGTGHKEDDHFGSGSIYKMPYDPASDMFGAPSPVVMSAGSDENNYYPSVSPDGNFL